MKHPIKTKAARTMKLENQIAEDERPASPAPAVHPRRLSRQAIDGVQTILQDPKRRTQLLLTAAFLAVGLWTMITMLIIDVRAFSALPWGDHWDHWRLVLKDGYSLGTFFHLHNEHRIALPRLWFMIDHYLFGATDVFVFTSIFLIQLGHALMLWRIGARASGQGLLGSLALGSVMLAALFSSQQFSNFTWAFQITFVSVYVLGTASLYALMRSGLETQPSSASPKASLRWFVFAVLLSIGTTYTISNGLIIWPVLLAFAVSLRMSWRRVGIIGGTGVIMWAVYLYGWHSPGHHISPLESFLNPPRIVAFMLVYVGAPADDTLAAINKVFGLGDNYRVLLAAVIGLIALLAAFRATLRSLEKRVELNSAQLALLFNMIFILCTAVITAVARGIQFNPADALTSRYSTPALLFWSCLVALLWSFRVRRDDPVFVQPRSTFQLWLVAGVFLLIAINQTPRFAYVKGYDTYLGEVEAAITGRVYDEPVWNRVYYDPKGMLPVVQFFWKNHLSVFKPDWTRWPGRRLRDLFEVTDSTPACMGWVDNTTLIPAGAAPGFRIVGWAWDHDTANVLPRIILANENGVVIGIGRSGYDRPDVSKNQPLVKETNVGWVSYVSTGGFEQINAYILRKDGRRVCKIGTLQAGNKLDFAPLSDVGSAFPGPQPTPASGWFMNGAPPNVGRPGLPDNVLGSWNASDSSSTGAVSIGPFTAPRNTSSIAIPVVTGASASKCSIRLINSDTGETLASMAQLPSISQWMVVKLDFPPLADDRKLSIMATDNGTESDAWFAIGQPHRLIH